MSAILIVVDNARRRYEVPIIDADHDELAELVAMLRDKGFLQLVLVEQPADR